jgi:E3 ubiquitin-protein ligase NEDD4
MIIKINSLKKCKYSFTFSINLLCYDSIKEKTSALLAGFRSLIPADIISIFNIEELDFLLSGQGEIDLSDWKSNTIYKGLYSENHKVIFYFI